MWIKFKAESKYACEDAKAHPPPGLAADTKATAQVPKQSTRDWRGWGWDAVGPLGAPPPREHPGGGTWERQGSPRSVCPVQSLSFQILRFLGASLEDSVAS